MSSRPSDKRHLYRWVVVGLTVAGLVINYSIYLMVNLVSWFGGPFALFAVMAFTLVIGLVLWFLPVQSSVAQGIVLMLAVCLWLFGTLRVFFWADTVQQKLWIEDTERVARTYGLGDLPPDCRITGTYRGSLHTPIECKGEVADVAAWYRGRLAPDWVESMDRGAVIFTRTPNQEIRIYRDIVFTKGTSVVVSPTQTNNL